MQRSAGATGAEAGAYQLHLSELSPLAGLFLDLCMNYAFTCYFFLEEVTGALASREELAIGASIGRVGLEFPPRSPVIGATPRPTAPRLERGMGMCLHCPSHQFVVYVGAYSLSSIFCVIFNGLGYDHYRLG
jgi:hypothetical protein